jgi:hypothetical protein
VPEMTPISVGQAGTELYLRAGLSSSTPPPGGAATVAERILGLGSIYEHRGARAEACLARVGSAARIVLRAGLPTRRANWLVGHELAHYVLDDRPWFALLSYDERELWCDRVGSWVCAPAEALRQLVDSHGLALAPIARSFAIAETSVALRVVEERIERGVDVVTPARVHRRGDVPWPIDRSRELAKRRKISTGTMVAITDEEARKALFIDYRRGRVRPR